MERIKFQHFPRGLMSPDGVYDGKPVVNIDGVREPYAKMLAINDQYAVLHTQAFTGWSDGDYRYKNATVRTCRIVEKREIMNGFEYDADVVITYAPIRRSRK